MFLAILVVAILLIVVSIGSLRLTGDLESKEKRKAELEAQIEAVLANPDVTGIFLWQFADVRVDESWAPHRPRGFNNKGVVDEYRRAKLAYGTVKALFHKL